MQWTSWQRMPDTGRSWRWLDDLGRDVRHAAGGLRRSPGFSAAVALILALGIGANTAMFSIVYGVLVRPLPYPDAGAIVRVGDSFGTRTLSAMLLSNRSMPLLQELSESFEQLAAYEEVSAEWDGAAGVVLPGARVSPSLFPLLRAAPLLGRLFLDEEARTGAGTRRAAEPRRVDAALRIRSGHRRSHHRIGRRPASGRRRARRGVPLPDPGQRILDAVRHSSVHADEHAGSTGATYRLPE